MLDTTDTAPMPAFVAAPAMPADAVDALRTAFQPRRAPGSRRSWDELLLQGFAAVTREDFAPTLAWDREAKAAGYPAPL